MTSISSQLCFTWIYDGQRIFGRYIDVININIHSLSFQNIWDINDCMACDYELEYQMFYKLRNSEELGIFAE